MPSWPNRPAPKVLTEHDPWLRRLAQKYALPRAVIARQLCARGALEYEIAQLIVDAAIARAHTLIADKQAAPMGTDLFDRAVRGVYTRLAAARDAEEQAERMRRYAETDAYLARVKAGLEE